MHFISRQKTSMNALIIGEIIFYVHVCGGGFVFQITRGFCIQLFKEYWFSMKYIVKRKNWHTFGTWVQGAFFPILNPCGYHKKKKNFSWINNSDFFNNICNTFTKFSWVLHILHFVKIFSHKPFSVIPEHNGLGL